MRTWTEPTTRLLRWGGYRARHAAGLTTIMLGVAATNLTSTYSLWFLAIGPGVQLVGWLLLPGVVAGLVLVAGPDFAGAFVVLLAGWLFARHRPPLSYLALLPPLAAVFLFKAELRQYDQNWLMLLAGSLVTVAAAWLAWWLAARMSATRRIPSAAE
jgi:hypothetical protein